MQVPNGTGPAVRRSKRPLASRTRCNVLWKRQKFGNKVKIGIKVQFGKKFANWCNVWSIEGFIVYGHVPECHATFRRGRLHNVGWDPHIDHKTSWGTISNVPWHIPVWGARKPVNYTSWVAVVTPTDRPKSVRNCCLIELFCGVVCVATLPLWHFCWYRGFCHRTGSDLLLFVLRWKSHRP